MKKLAAIALAATLATNSMAGGLAPVIIEEPIIVEEAQSSFPVWIIPLIIVGLLVLISQEDCYLIGDTNTSSNCIQPPP